MVFVSVFIGLVDAHPGDLFLKKGEMLFFLEIRVGFFSEWCSCLFALVLLTRIPATFI